MKGKVEVCWGDAVRLLGQDWQKLCSSSQEIEFLFLDGTPREYLSYLKAAEPHLADGAVVVADNAGVFAEVPPPTFQAGHL